MRSLFLFLALAASPAAAAPHAHAFKLLIAAPVSDMARDIISPEVWEQVVAGSVQAVVIPFAGERPTGADCLKAHADYLLLAPFELRPRLPGVPTATDRIGARTHLVLIECLSGTVSDERTIDLDGDPSGSPSPSDTGNPAQTGWSRALVATLARAPLAFRRPMRVLVVSPPLARVDPAGRRLKPGGLLRDIADKDGRRKTPIVLSVTQTFDSYVEVLFVTLEGAPAPQKGDIVEVLPAPT